jgi:hypothetical protein
LLEAEEFFQGRPATTTPVSCLAMACDIHHGMDVISLNNRHNFLLVDIKAITDKGVIVIWDMHRSGSGCNNVYGKTDRPL